MAAVSPATRHAHPGAGPTAVSIEPLGAVARTTHSSWAVVFSHIGALVTDGGGMLSHPAIIAREYDIPAVLATGRATSTLIDGQIVTVDGATGRVRIH